MTKEWIRELEDMPVEAFQTGIKREKEWGEKREQNIQELWDNYKKYNMCIMGIPKKKKKELKKYLKIR